MSLYTFDRARLAAESMCPLRWLSGSVLFSNWRLLVRSPAVVPETYTVGSRNTGKMFEDHLIAGLSTFLAVASTPECSHSLQERTMSLFTNACFIDVDRIQRRVKPRFTIINYGLFKKATRAVLKRSMYNIYISRSVFGTP